MRLELQDFRNYLVYTLKELSDKEFQLKNWTDLEATHFFWDNIRFPLDWIDDLTFFDQPAEEQIGYVLYNQEEAELIKALVNCFNIFLDKVGGKKPDAEYINSPYWDAVIESAKKAHDLLSKNDNLYKEKP